MRNGHNIWKERSKGQEGKRVEEEGEKRKVDSIKEERLINGRHAKKEKKL